MMVEAGMCVEFAARILLQSEAGSVALEAVVQSATGSITVTIHLYPAY